MRSALGTGIRVGIGFGVGVGLLALTAGAAGAMQVEPGKWEFRASGQAMDKGQLEVTTTCVSDGEITPDVFTEDALGCTVSDAKNDATSMSWTMKCDTGNGGEMQGSANFQSKGKSVEGAMKLRFNAGGVTMAFERQWEGKRLGPCD